jgi:D-methionine transport system permease protein
MTELILQSCLETLLMVGVATLVSILLGIPLAILLSITTQRGLWPHPWINHSLSTGVNAIRSIPYIILVVLLMPITRMMVGSAIGTLAAIIPLSLAGALLLTRGIEDALRNIQPGLIEVGIAMGASKWQIIRKILLAEALPSIVASITMVIINLIGFSAMAGAVGGGGLGDLAIRYGYQRYDLGLMITIVMLLVIMVQLVQMLGDYLTKKLSK